MCHLTLDYAEQAVNHTWYQVLSIYPYVVTYIHGIQLSPPPQHPPLATERAFAYISRNR